MSTDVPFTSDVTLISPSETTPEASFSHQTVQVQATSIISKDVDINPTPVSVTSNLYTAVKAPEASTLSNLTQKANISRAFSSSFIQVGAASTQVSMSEFTHGRLQSSPVVRLESQTSTAELQNATVAGLQTTSTGQNRMITATPTPFSVLSSLSETAIIARQTSTPLTSILETATTQLIDVMFTSSADVITTSFFAMPSHPNSFTASEFTQSKQMERQSPPVLPLQTSVVTSHSLAGIFVIDSSMFTDAAETSQEIMIPSVSSTFLGGFQMSARVASLSLGDQLQATKSVVITASASAGFEHVSSTVDSPSNLSITQASTSSMSLLNNINMSTVSPLMSLPTSLTRPLTINATEMVANSFSPIVKPSAARHQFSVASQLAASPTVMSAKIPKTAAPLMLSTQTLNSLSISVSTIRSRPFNATSVSMVFPGFTTSDVSVSMESVLATLRQRNATDVVTSLLSSVSRTGMLTTDRTLVSVGVSSMLHTSGGNANGWVVDWL